MGAIAGFLSWHLGFVWLYRIWPPTQFITTGAMLSRLAALSNPDQVDGFFAAYVSLLYDASKAAWYRMVQSLLAIVPVAIGFWICWSIGYPWIFVLVATVVTACLGIHFVVFQIRRTGNNAAESE